MGFGYPAISIKSMTNSSDFLGLDEETEFSWFGKSILCVLFLNQLFASKTNKETLFSVVKIALFGLFMAVETKVLV